MIEDRCGWSEGRMLSIERGGRLRGEVQQAMAGACGTRRNGLNPRVSGDIVVEEGDIL